MVFFSSCNSVKYHAELLNYIDIPVKDIHGKQKQQRRTSTFMEFCKVRASGLSTCKHVCYVQPRVSAAPRVDLLTPLQSAW
jgi:ATP-dependent RNA helicase DDX18/HAS1